MSLSNKIINWLKNYSDKTNLCFVVGVSGGIDSALVSTMCAKTGVMTHVVNLPISQNENQVILAKQHMDWLSKNFSNVKIHEVNLTQIFNHLKKELNQYNSELGFVNSKSRLRMLALYQIASYHNGLVVGTGNKVEDFGIGFFTKYGDGGVDISPIADLTKTEVRILSEQLGVDKSIINAKPTDGLWEDDRTDEEQIGATYSELEWAMDFESKNKIIKLFYNLSERKKNVLSIFKKLNKKNKHKMVQIPIFKKK
ncbi:MAG: hypothetical protein RLZ10_1450 [Bacteroidota bacterium]|jgi:NAD+ synthase